MTSAFKLHDTVIKVSSEAERLLPTTPMITEEKKLLSELILCIVSSQEKYEAALALMKTLEKEQILYVPKNKKEYNRIALTLSLAFSKPVTFQSGGKKSTRRIRFHTQKFRHVLRTIENIYLRKKTISILISESRCVFATRNNVIEYAVGVGPKQASMFLRNIGYYSDYAILDKHVIDYMRIMGMTSFSSNSVQSIVAYRKLELILQEYAYEYKLNLAYLDIAIWTTMRTAKNYC